MIWEKLRQNRLMGEVKRGARLPLRALSPLCECEISSLSSEAARSGPLRLFFLWPSMFKGFFDKKAAAPAQPKQQSSAAGGASSQPKVRSPLSHIVAAALCAAPSTSLLPSLLPSPPPPTSLPAEG